MKELTIYRSDFRNSQDHPHESLFEGILQELGIPKKRWDKIDEVTIKDILPEDIECEDVSEVDCYNHPENPPICSEDK